MDLLIALIPLIMIFICLFIFKLSALYSGLIAFLFTSALVLVGVNFELSLSEVLDSIIAGILISSIAAYVIFFGILLFHLMNETKNIDLISQKIKLLTNDKALKVIILVVGISPLIESTSGFGTSFLIITPILISLGIENYKATFIGILSLIAVPWGALATGTVIGTELVGLGLKKVGFITALLTIPTIIYFLALCIFILGGKKAVNQNKYKILLYSVTFTLTNIIFNYFISVELSGVFSSLITLLIGIIYIKSKSTKIIDYKSLLNLLSPYILLTLLVFITRTIPIIDDFLKNNFVLISTKFNYQLPLLYSPGFWLIIACIYTIFKFKISKNLIQISFKKTIKQWRLFVVSTTLFIALSQIMDSAGMIKVISNNLGDTFDNCFIVVSAFIGSLGGFLTGSNTGANAMFMKLQIQIANQVNISSNLIAGLQNASASNATMITPSRIMLASELYNIREKENKLLIDLIKVILVSIILLILVAHLVNNLFNI